MVENFRIGASAVRLENITVRNVPGLAVAVWAATTSNLVGTMVFENVGQPKIWVRSGEVFTERIPNLGVPILIGMTNDDIDRYFGFRPVRRIQVWVELSVEAGARVEFRPNGGIILLKDGAESDSSSLIVEGTEEAPVVFATEEPGTKWGGIDIRSTNRATLVRWAELEDCGSAVQVGFQVPNGFVRMENTTVRRCNCAVNQEGDRAQVELVDLTLEETDDAFCP